MSVSVSDILPLVKDYSRNQNLDTARGIRAINSAIQFVKAQISLPGHESEYTFKFFDDQYFYPVPDDFNEPISLRYVDDRFNREHRFTFVPGELLFERVKAKTFNTRLWGTYYGTGAPQLMVLAKNKMAPILIDSFDSQTTITWVASGDTSGLTYDTYTKKEGAASLSFDTLVNVANYAGLIGSQAATDYSQMQNVGHFRLWVFIPEVTDFTSVSLKWGSDNSDYYIQTATEQEDGTAFEIGWNAIDLPWDNTAIEVGNCNPSAITFLEIDLNYDPSFSVPISDWRVDYLRIGAPDSMTMSYYVNRVGVNVSGSPIVNVSAIDDTFLFGDIDPALMQLVAVQAAVILNPQILVDDKAVRQIYTDFTTLYKRNYPRKKVNNLMSDPSVSQTSGR